MIKSAYLRVYLPEDQVRGLDQHRERNEIRTRRWEPYGFVGESMIDDAWVTDWQGGTYVCPRRPQLRMLEGVLALYRALEIHGRPVIIPEKVARQADRELRQLQRTEPDIRSHILTSAWHVPLRWFVPFQGSDRIFLANQERPSLRYRTALADATMRINRAARVLTEFQLPEALVAELSALEAWLSDFSNDAMVELDYGGVAEMFSEADLALDDSAAEVWASIEALAEGDGSSAGEHYGNVMARWAPIFAVAYSN